MPTLEEVIARLDKQAAAIRDLRKRVAALEEGPVATASNSGAPAQGRYMHTYLCALCGADNGSRKTLLCKKCSGERTAQIKGLLPRPSYPTCCNCKGAKTPSMNLLCTPCGRDFKRWKAV